MHPMVALYRSVGATWPGTETKECPAVPDRKILRLMCAGNTFDTMTLMPDKEIREEIEYDHWVYQPSNMETVERTEGKRDQRWCRLECVNLQDERTPVAYLREDIRGYVIMPWHPAAPDQTSPIHQASRIMR